MRKTIALILADTRAMRSNCEGTESTLAVLARYLETRENGILIGTSVHARGRYRAVSFVYGSAKTGFTVFLSGLRNRIAKSNLHAAVVFPGLLATKMNEGMKLPKTLTTLPLEAAEAVVRTVYSKRNIICSQLVRHLIAYLFRNIPEPIAKGMYI